MTPTRYFKQSPIVSRFLNDFHRVESCDLQLNDGHHYQKKHSSNGTEVVYSSFGLVSVLLRQKTSSKLRNFLNKLDLSVNENSQATSPVVMTPPNSGEKSDEISFPSPNLKEIIEKDDLDTPEKALPMKRRGSRVIKDVYHKHEKVKQWCF